MRTLIAFPCEGETLIGSLDAAAGTTGLLIVAGGNEPRMGAHRGMALLAARVAAAGWPVFRYDRRGVGDSSGENGGWATSAPDLAAAATAFRAAAPQIERLIGFGNCDAATTLALFGSRIGIRDVILANPWLGDEGDDLPPREAIRQRYAERLRQPATWWRLLSGQLNIAKLIAGVRKLSRGQPDGVGSLERQVVQALHNRDLTLTVVLATDDATALRFDAATRRGIPFGIDYIRLPTDSHSFARTGDADALFEVVRGVLGAPSC